MYTLRLRLGKAFTLIELLIVITIIGILAVALVPKITGAPAAARDVSRKAAINSLATAIQQFVSDNGSYPVKSPDGTVNITPAAGQGIANCLEDGNNKVGGSIAKYTGGQVPVDPISNRSITYYTGYTCTGKYHYIVLGDGSGAGAIIKGYMLGALMEKGSNGNNKGCFGTSSVLPEVVGALANCADIKDIPGGGGSDKLTSTESGPGTDGFILFESLS